MLEKENSIITKKWPMKTVRLIPFSSEATETSGTATIHRHLRFYSVVAGSGTT